MERFARRTFGDLPGGYQRVNAICNWIRDHVDYISGSSDALTSAFDTVTERAGVCRDFAHLAIALCRALGIPARYVSAYAWRLSPPDFHAVIEAYLQGPTGPGWYLFDPTRMSAPDGLVRIGIGRDAAEVAFCTVYGQMEAEKPEVWITSDRDPAEALTTSAVRAQERQRRGIRTGDRQSCVITVVPRHPQVASSGAAQFLAPHLQGQPLVLGGRQVGLGSRELADRRSKAARSRP